MGKKQRPELNWPILATSSTASDEQKKLTADKVEKNAPSPKPQPQNNISISYSHRDEV